jgi:hypothetical protein
VVQAPLFASVPWLRTGVAWGGVVAARARPGAWDSAIGGNYSCNNCASASLEASTVGGNYQISGATAGSDILPPSKGGDEPATVIKGNLQITTSRGEFDILGISVGGNLTFNNNTGPASITNNTIGGNLQCQNNVPPPTSTGNTAKSYQGQCTA